MSKLYLEPEDLLSDETFLEWYFQSAPGEAGTWDQWAAGHPDRQQLMDKAVLLLKSTRIREQQVADQRLRKAQDALMQSIAGLPKGGLSSHPADVEKNVSAEKPMYRMRWMLVAACLVLVVGAGLIVRVMTSTRHEMVTAYGQTGDLQLPDGTDVTLNANSRLTYSVSSKDGGDRQVWLRGEAFFHVRRTPLKSRFVVHTDQFDVTVTGTQFNVVSRSGLANVMLSEGSVSLHSLSGQDLAMVPGDFVEWDHQMLTKRAVNADSLTAWKEHRLIFDKTPLSNVVVIIAEQYGVKVALGDQSIADSTISGIMPNDNLDELLNALETTSDFDVIRDSGAITIRAHSRN